jgi:hypothetical protein
MADIFSLVMAIVCVISAIFILILVASFAWVCIRALAIDDTLLDFHDEDSKSMREPLVENIFAQDLKGDTLEMAPCTSV